MATTEIATAYVSIVPETKQLKAGIQDALKDIGNMRFSPMVDPQAGQRAGRQFGQAFHQNARVGDVFGSGVTGKMIASANSVGQRMGQALSSSLKVAAMGVIGGVGLSLAGVLVKGFERITALDTAKHQLKNMSDTMVRFGKDALNVEQILKDVTDVVTGTPIALQDAFGMVPQLLNAGIKPGEQLTGVLRTIADTAGSIGKTDSFGRISVGIQQVLRQGHLTNQDVMTWFSDVSMYDWLAESMKIPPDQVQKMITDGKIGIREVMTALADHTAGMAKEMGQTVEGAMANMTTSASRAAANFIAAIFGTDQISAGDDIVKIIEQVTEKFNELSTWINSNRGEIHDFFSDLGGLSKGVYNLTEMLGGAKTAVELFLGAWALSKGWKLAAWLTGIAEAAGLVGKTAATAAGGVGALGAASTTAATGGLAKLSAALGTVAKVGGAVLGVFLALEAASIAFGSATGQEETPNYTRGPFIRTKDGKIVQIPAGADPKAMLERFPGGTIVDDMPEPGKPGSLTDKSFIDNLPGAFGAGSDKMPAPELPFPVEYGRAMMPGETPEEYQQAMRTIEAQHRVDEAQARVNQLREANVTDEQALIKANNDLAQAKAAQIQVESQAAKQRREKITVPYREGYGAAPRPGQTAQQYSDEQKLFEVVQRREQAEANLRALQNDSTATQADVIAATNDLNQARVNENETMLRLQQGATGAGDGLSNLANILNQNFVGGGGLAGLAEGLLRFVAALAAAPVQGLLSGVQRGLAANIPAGYPYSLQGSGGGGGVGGLAGLGALLAPGGSGGAGGSGGLIQNLFGGRGAGTAPTLGAMPGNLHGSHAQIGLLAQLAAGQGLQFTSGADNHPVDNGFHPIGQAGDFSNQKSMGPNTPEMTAYANELLKYAPYLQELIYSGAPFNVLGGKLVPTIDQPGSPFTTAQAGYHGDHVHAAIRDEMASQFQAAVGGGAPAGGSSIQNLFGGRGAGGGLSRPSRGGSTPAGLTGPKAAAYQAMIDAGFPPSEWAALEQIISHESSFNPAARNPSSGAFGMYQFLGHENDKYGQMGGYSSDPAQQSVAGMQYIKDRYGSPSNAWGTWQAQGWYAGGGGIPGSGSGDIVPIMSEPGEHMLTKSDVAAMGGQQAVYDFRAALHREGGGPTPFPPITPDTPPIVPTDLGGLLGAPPTQTDLGALMGAPAPAAPAGGPAAATGPSGPTPVDPPPVPSTPPPFGQPSTQISDDTTLGPARGETPHGGAAGAGNLPGPTLPSLGAPLTPEAGQELSQDEMIGRIAAGFIPKAAQANTVAGTSNLSRMWMMGAEVINGLIDQGKSIASTAISSGIAAGVAGGTMGMGAPAAPAAGAAGAAAADFLIGMGTEAAKRGVSYVAQMGGIATDATVEQLFGPLGGPPHWAGFAKGGAVVFDQGGMLQPGQAGINLSSRPEPVLTGAQWESMLQTRAGGRSFGVHMENVYVSDVNQMKREIDSQQKLAMMRYAGRP